MKVPHRQLNPWGCGHYTLANLFDDVRFLEDIEERTPSFTYDMQKSIDRYQPGLWLSPIFLVNTHLPIQNRFVDTALFEMDFDKMEEYILETHARAFLVCVKFNPLHHLILVLHRMKDNLFYIVDSLREEITVMTPEEFTLKYYVVEIWHFENDSIKESTKNFSEETKTLFFNVEHLNHLIQDEI